MWKSILDKLKGGLNRLFFILLRFFFTVCKPKGFITCAGKADGGGAQIHAMLSVQLLATDFNLRYLHTPLTKVAHKPEKVLSSDWGKDWETYFNFWSVFPTIDNRINYRKKYVKSALEALKCFFFSSDSTLLVITRFGHDYADLWPDRYRRILHNYQIKAFMACPKSLMEKQNNTYRVAVHVRRGDVNILRNKNRYNSAEDILKVIGLIHEKYPKEKLRVTIFTNSLDDDLWELKKQGFNVDHTSDVFKVLDSLITSDVLVIAKSSLSYIAALFCKGDVYYFPFWHKPLRGWNIVTCCNSGLRV